MASDHFSVQEINQRKLSRKSVKIIVALVTVTLMLVLIILIVALWQTEIIFPSSTEENSKNAVAKVVKNDIGKNVGGDAATEGNDERTRDVATGGNPEPKRDVANDVTNEPTRNIANTVSHEPGRRPANGAATDGTIYFATMGSGIMALSPKTLEVTTVINNQEAFYAVALDALNSKIYWTSSSKLYRSKTTGTEVETLLATSEYGTFWGLGWDWIANLVYVVTERGFVIACDGGADSTAKCATILSGQGKLQGIALDPNNGIMYLTSSAHRSIIKAHMDGSNLATFVSGLNSPAGVVIDRHSSRLYWAEWGDRRIQFSSLDVGSAITISNTDAAPWGIAIVDQRVYWSLMDEKRITSSAQIGGEILNIHSGSSWIMHLAVQDSALLGNRQNPCSGQPCQGLCVLTPTSFKCLSVN